MESFVTPSSIKIRLSSKSSQPFTCRLDCLSGGWLVLEGFTVLSETGFELMIFLSQLPEFWDYKSEPMANHVLFVIPVLGLLQLFLSIVKHAELVCIFPCAMCKNKQISQLYFYN